MVFSKTPLVKVPPLDGVIYDLHGVGGVCDLPGADRERYGGDTEGQGGHGFPLPHHLRGICQLISGLEKNVALGIPLKVHRVSCEEDKEGWV